MHDGEHNLESTDRFLRIDSHNYVLITHAQPSLETQLARSHLFGSLAEIDFIKFQKPSRNKCNDLSEFQHWENNQTKYVRILVSIIFRFPLKVQYSNKDKKVVFILTKWCDLVVRMLLQSEVVKKKSIEGTEALLFRILDKRCQSLVYLGRKTGMLWLKVSFLPRKCHI